MEPKSCSLMSACQTKSCILACALCAAVLSAEPAYSYHPLSTDDPGTTEPNHFELEYGSDFIADEYAHQEAVGYVAVKSGLLPGLEMDTVVSFTYWREDDELSSSGWSDGEIALKYRFLGDGDGPTNMGIEGIFTLPSGEAEKDLRGSDEIVPTAFLFGTVGVQDFRVLMNAGATFNPDEHDVALYGLAFEWTATESWTFVSEIYGENDFEHGGGNDPFEGGVGAVWGVNDALTLSGGVSFGLNEYAPDTRFTLAALIGW